MDPMTAMLLSGGLQSLPALYQLFQGIGQTRAGKRLAERTHDPVMSIPKSAEEALASARTYANPRTMVGQSNMENRIDASSANTISDVMRAARSPQDAIAALTAIQAKNVDANVDIAGQAARDYAGRQGELRNQLGVMSQWENQVWRNNVLNKFLRDSATASALQNAGMQNTMGGMGSLANTASTTIMNLPKGAEGGISGAGAATAGANAGAMGGFPKKTTSIFDNIPITAAEQNITDLQTPTMATPNVSSQNIDPAMMLQFMQAMGQINPQFLQTGGYLNYNN